VSYSDVKKLGVDEVKLASLDIADRYVYRPIATFLLPMLYNIFKLTPNKISIVSMVLAAIGFAFILASNVINVIIGSSFLLLFRILDSADGSLARTLFYKYNFNNPIGEFYDALAGYFVICGLWPSFGYYLYFDTGESRWFVLGVLSALTSLYSRTAHLKLLLVEQAQTMDTNIDLGVKQKYIIKIYKNLDWGGFLLILIPAAVWYGFLQILLILYLGINFGMLIGFFRHAYIKTMNYQFMKE